MQNVQKSNAKCSNLIRKMFNSLWSGMSKIIHSSSLMRFSRPYGTRNDNGEVQNDKTS